ncbi:hypothetical protein [Devosia sp. 2618]|uniref:hypothetical protein n=1 Tax=Devosia sp. 2618 TaxID=3156454 RepID=UPI00339906E9
MAYAETTSVSVEKTEGQIKAMIKKAGATHFATMDEAGMAIIAFSMKDRAIRFNLPLSRQDDRNFALNGRGAARTADQRYAAWEQACRSRWRALYLCIKAKLESIESGIETFEDAFLANIQMADGRLVSEIARPPDRGLLRGRRCSVAANRTCPLAPSPSR